MKRIFLSVMFLLVVLGSAIADPVRIVLPNGLRMIHVTTTATPLVSLEILVDCSALDEPMQVQGLRKVLLYSMLQGSQTADGATITRQLADVGGIMTGRVQQDSLEISVTVPASALPLALDSLQAILRHPQLSDLGIQAIISQAKREAAVMPTGTIDAAEWYANMLIYTGLPYATQGVGYPETIEQITPEFVRLAYRYFISPSNTVLAIAGPVTATEAQAQVIRTFGAWERGAPLGQRETISSPTLGTSQSILRELPVQSTGILLTFPVCGATQRDYLTLRVIDAVLSGGTGSRLFRSVREQQHLAYEVASRLTTQRNDNTFSLYALTYGRRLDDTRMALAAELSKLQTEAVTASELQRAKAYLKGKVLLSHQSGAQYAYDLCWDDMVGLGIDYDKQLPALIDAVTVGDIQRIARAYFTHYYLVAIVPQAIDPVTQ